MGIMQKMLDSLGSVWSTLPKDIPAIKISRRAGPHRFITIDGGSIYFHSAPFRSDLPQKQVIVLDGLTLSDLATTIGRMGYNATITSEAITAGLHSMGAGTLLEVVNVAIDEEQPFASFTSDTWRLFYPIYRTLRRLDTDIDTAFTEVPLPLATGSWLDYWATFFSLTREPGETDSTFIRRILMWFFNPKTNNIALKELLSYQLNDNNVEVDDTTPANFQVTISTKYIDTADILHKIIKENKGGGIGYALNYVSDDSYTEDWRLAVSDMQGKPFSSLDVMQIILSYAMNEEVYDTAASVLEDIHMNALMNLSDEFPMVAINSGTLWDSGFSLNSSELNTGYNPALTGGDISNDQATISITVNGVLTGTIEV